MLLTIVGYVVAAVVGATVVKPVAKAVVSATKTKKDDKAVDKVYAVLDKIPTTHIVTYLATKGVKVPEFKF